MNILYCAVFALVFHFAISSNTPLALISDSVTPSIMIDSTPLTTVSTSSFETTVAPNTTTPSTPLPTTSTLPQTITSKTTMSTLKTTPTTPITTPSTHETTPTTPKTTPSTPKTTPSTPKTTPSTPKTTPSTTLAPTTEPTPTEGNWTVEIGNVTCIRANLKILFKIPDNNTVEEFPLSPNASSDGSTCNGFNGTQTLELQWPNGELTMYFEKDSVNVFLSNISLSYVLPNKRGLVYNDEHRFIVKAGNSYLCLTAFDVSLGNVTMQVQEIHVQAFGTTEKDYGESVECDADNPVSDAVPIAVGVILLALVIIVLVAYLIGRRRNQNGYQSV